MPKASFVVACYNGTAYLADTLEACLGQDVEDIEVVVVDDGSTDSTKEVMDYYAKRDKRIVPVYLEKNVGRSMARNAGINVASADIILITDADDIPALDRVKRTLGFFKDTPEAEIMYGGFWVMDEVGEVQASIEGKPFDYQRMLAHRSKFWEIGHSSMAFRKRVFKKIQYSAGAYSDLAIDDWKLQTDAYRAGIKVGHIKHPLFYYRVIPKERDEKKIMELKEAALA